MQQNDEAIYEFAAVDQATDPNSLVEYLETATSLGAIQRYKQESYAAMQASLGQRILDVGCGTGDDVLALAKIVGSMGHVIGIDNSAIMIAKATEKAGATNLPVVFQTSGADNLKFASNSFDSCRADRVFQHLAERQCVLAEMIRVVRPGGRVVVADPDWDTLILRPADKAVSRRVAHSSADAVRHGASGSELYAQFKQAGLVNVGVEVVTLVITEFELAQQIFGIDNTIERMQLSGEISAENAASWRNQLTCADHEGHFFSALTGFIVSGEKAT